MARALSVDLRDRVVAAIAGRLSRREAAVRFGVSAASAVRWQQLANQHGTPAPQQQGGDRRSMKIEARAGLILDAYKATPDITLAELQALLADHVTRSALHRCLQRRGISLLPDIEGDKPKRQRFKRYPIGFIHVGIAEVQTAEGKLYLFVGIDRTASSQSLNSSTRLIGGQRGSSWNTC